MAFSLYPVCSTNVQLSSILWTTLLSANICMHFLMLASNKLCVFVWFYQVLILSERLHSVTAQFDRLRSMRFQEAINRAMPRKKIKKKTETKLVETPKSNLVLQSDVSYVGEEVSTAPLRVQEQLLDDETRALQVIFGWIHTRKSWPLDTFILYQFLWSVTKTLMPSTLRKTW